MIDPDVTMDITESAFEQGLESAVPVDVFMNLTNEGYNPTVGHEETALLEQGYNDSMH
jgi:hypothetical protein